MEIVIVFPVRYVMAIYFWSCLHNTVCQKPPDIQAEVWVEEGIHLEGLQTRAVLSGERDSPQVCWKWTMSVNADAVASPLY